jgi:predicted dehydrogenase
VDPPLHTASFGEFQLSYRYGDILIPHVPAIEPLRAECEHFLECIRHGRRPLSDARQGLTVVQVLETAQAALKAATMIPIPTSSTRAAAVNEPAAVLNGHV